MTQYDYWVFYYISCGALVSHLFPLGHPCPHLLSLGILSHISAFPWVFTNSFEFPRPSYLILHPWGLWPFHQPLTFFTCITSSLLWPTLTFLHHILSMGLLLLSLQAPLDPFASSWPICLFYGPSYYPLFLPLGLKGFFSIHSLTLLYPYCWASSLLLDFPKWASTLGLCSCYLGYFLVAGFVFLLSKFEFLVAGFDLGRTWRTSCNVLINKYIYIYIYIKSKPLKLSQFSIWA